MLPMPPVYDGATAAAEAASMCRERSRTVTYVSYPPATPRCCGR